MSKRDFLVPLIVLAGLAGALSAQSYAATSETRQNAKYLSLNESISPLNIKPYMKAKGYWVIEETTSAYTQHRELLCDGYGYASFLFENKSNSSEKVIIEYNHGLTWTGCQWRAAKIHIDMSGAEISIIDLESFEQ